MAQSGDSFFMTKNNLQSLKSVQLSSCQQFKSRRHQLDDMFDRYNVFKYSKHFTTKRRHSLQGIQSQRNYQNINTIKKESQQLKGRLQLMEKERKVMLEKLRLTSR